MKNPFSWTLSVQMNRDTIDKSIAYLRNHFNQIILVVLGLISVIAFIHYYRNGLGIAYNDARSHLDISRRVVESLKPGLAQIGSVWLPLPHILMLPTIWNDWMWHSGLSGAIPSMASYIFTGFLVVKYLARLGISRLGQFAAVLILAGNLNMVYLQATAMTEILLMATMTAAAYHFLCWVNDRQILSLVNAALWTSLASLVRYDGWFLFVLLMLLIGVIQFIRKKKESIEGYVIIFATLAGFGIFLWVLWNTLIFRDPLYFISGPYSARAQQKILENENKLPTKGNWSFSLYTYSLGTVFNIGLFPIVLGILGLIALMSDKEQKKSTKLATLALIAPFVFNVITLYMGQSVLYLQGITQETWFNVRYGLLSLPGVAIWIGYLVDKARIAKVAILVVILMSVVFMHTSSDAVTIDDGKVGASQKNVYEVSDWLGKYAGDEPGFVLISASSHDAILFSSGLKMKRFIHEGTGKYWEYAGQDPAKWARWIVMRTNDVNDNTFRLMRDNGQLFKYDLVQQYPFADIYSLKSEYMKDLITEPILGKQK